MTNARNQPTETVRTLLVNALSDVVEDTGDVLTDDASREVLDAAFRTATSEDERREFRRALTTVRDGVPETDPSYGVLGSLVDATYQELLERDVHVTVTHQTGTRLSPREVALHNFQASRETAELADLSLSPTVKEAVLAGARRALDGEHAAAESSFEEAIDAAETTDDAVTPRVLAGWTNHWAGDDRRALDYVEEALSLHYRAWSARVVAAVASHDTPQLFRNGMLSAGAYLRLQAAVSADADIHAAVALGEGEWRELQGQPEFLPLPRLDPDVQVRIELTGPIDDLPTLHAYYLAVGTVDEENEVPRTVEYQPLKGPATADVTETIRFESS